MTLFVALEGHVALPLAHVAAWPAVSPAVPTVRLSSTSRARRAFSSGFLLMGSTFPLRLLQLTLLSRWPRPSPTNTQRGLDGPRGRVFCVMVGLLFKVNFLPLPRVDPDVYTGAPTPGHRLHGSGVKIAAFAAIVASTRWSPPTCSGLPVHLYARPSAGLTILVGTFARPRAGQASSACWPTPRSPTRAFILMGILAESEGRHPGHVLFYTLGYGLATVGAFGVVTLVRGRDADGEATSWARRQACTQVGGYRPQPYFAGGTMLVSHCVVCGHPADGPVFKIGKLAVNFLRRDQGRHRLVK